jgi:hypothetical protein
MAFMRRQTRSSAVQSEKAPPDYQDMPPIPDELVHKFRFLADHQKAQQEHWQRMKTNLRDRDNLIEQLRKKINEIDARTAT